MPNFIRSQTTGAQFFFTLRLHDRHSNLLIREVDLLRSAMRKTKAHLPFEIDAIAILPAAIHMIWTLPTSDAGYGRRIAMLKSGFSRPLPMPEHRTMAQIRRAEKGIWQRRFWEHRIRDQEDFERHRDMIYLSPVHAGLCARPEDWAHTSLHRDRKLGRPAPYPVGYGAGHLHLTKKRIDQSKQSALAT